MRRPLDQPYTISGEFGADYGSAAKFRYHSGVDYAIPIGRNLYAPKAGRIVLVTDTTYQGKYLTLFDGQFYHRLMHCSQIRFGVGQQVSEGELIANSGNSGINAATGKQVGAHLHWDICKVATPTSFQEFIAPADWLAGKYETAKPAPLESWQRRVGAAGVYYRTMPNTSAPLKTPTGEFPANDIMDFKGFVKAQYVNGSDIWFVGRYTGGYSHSRSFQDSSTNGLPDLTPAPANPTPVPATPLPTPAPAPTFSARPEMGLWLVDISSHQKSLSAKALNDYGIAGGILRSGHVGKTYGGDDNQKDPLLDGFREDFRANGMLVGYYWFCYWDENPVREATSFVGNSKALPGESLWADIEEGGGVPSKEKVLAFVETVELLSGRPCHGYSNHAFVKQYPWLAEIFTGDRKFWIAHYGRAPGADVSDTPVGKPVMHQYSSSGKLPSVASEYIDLNVFYGSPDEFKALGHLRAIPEPEKPATTPSPAPTTPTKPQPSSPKAIVVSFLASIAALIAALMALIND